MRRPHRTVIVDNNKSITAVFEEKKFGLFIHKIGFGFVGGDGIDCGNQCYQEYSYDETVRLTAIPEPGFYFSEWLGDYTSVNGNQARIDMTGSSEKHVTAVFCEEILDPPTTVPPPTTTTPEPTTTPPSYTLSVIKDGEGYVESVDGGIDCGPTCANSYEKNTQVILLEPTPAQGWEFTGWSGHGFGSQNRTVIMNASKEVTAHFEAEIYTLQVLIEGQGNVESYPQGIFCEPDCEQTYEFGTDVELTASAATGYTFIQWQIDLSGSNQTDVVTITGNKVVRAIFAKQEFTLEVEVQGIGRVITEDGNINCPDDECVSTYEYGSQVYLTAQATSSDYEFSHWEEDLSGTSTDETILIDSNKFVRAVFTPVDYKLHVNINGSGSVISDPSGIDCEPNCSSSYEFNTIVDLVATAHTGWTFVEWTGDVLTTNLECDILIDSTKSVTAHFTINYYMLEVEIEGGGRVESTDNHIICPDESCSQQYEYNSVVDLIATPDEHWEFSHWEEDLTSSDASESVTVDSDKLVRAVFVLKKYTLEITIDGNGSVVNNDKGIDCDDNCTYQIEYGTNVDLEALPSTGWSFTNWSQHLSGHDPNETILIDGNKQVTAHFEINHYTLDVETTGQGNVNTDDGHIECPPNSQRQHVYEYNTHVGLTAIPEEHWTLDRWEGDLDSSNTSENITIISDKYAHAIFVYRDYRLRVEINGEGNVVSSPGNIDCPDACVDFFQYNTTVDLTATPSTGWSFGYWSYDLSGNNPNEDILIDENKVVVAVFQINQYTLYVEIEGNGNVTSTPTGIDCPGDCFQEYDYNTIVNLTADADEHWEFSHWEHDLSGSNTHSNIQIDEDKYVKAVFKKKDYTLNVNIEGVGEVTSDDNQIDCPDNNCTEQYTYNSVVELTASAGHEYYFVEWTGDIISTELIESLTILGNKEVTAHFQINQYTLNVEIEGNGSVLSDPTGIQCPASSCSQAYDYNTTVTLMTDPDEHWEFSHWEQDLSGTNTNEDIQIDEDKYVKAVFKKKDYTLNVNIEGNGNVTSDDNQIDCPDNNCTEQYVYIDNVTLTASPGYEYHFVEWTGDITGVTTTKSFYMTQDRNVTAHFQINQYTLNVEIEGSGDVVSDLGNIDCPEHLCSDEYDYDTTVNLTAEPRTGYYFTEWYVTDWDGPSSDLEDISIDILVNKHRTAIAYFEIYTYEFSVSIESGDGKVYSTDDNISCGLGDTDCSHVYDHGSDIVLNVEPGEGYYFDRWNGDITGDNQEIPKQINNITNDKHVEAYFKIIQYNLTVTKNGYGYIESSPSGIEYGQIEEHPAGDKEGDVNSAYFDYHTLVTLQVYAAVGYKIYSVSGDYESVDKENGIIEVFMDDDKEIHIEFIESEFLLRVRNLIDRDNGRIESDIENCIDCRYKKSDPPPESCNCVVPRNYNVQLNAIPDEHYRLQTWVVEGVTIEKVGTGYGSIWVVRDGDYIYITPDPHPDFEFCGWDGEYEEILENNVAKVKRYDDNIVYVCFDFQRRQLTVYKTGNGDGYVISEPAGIHYGIQNEYMFSVNSQVILSVQLDGGHHIESVSGDYDSWEDNQIYVTMDDHKAIEIEIEFSCYDLYVENMTNDDHGYIISRPEGIHCPNECHQCMSIDEFVQLEAIPDENYMLKAWEYQEVTIYKEGYGFGIIYLVQDGNTIYLTPDPHPGYEFCGWTGVDDVQNTIAEVEVYDRDIYCCFSVPTRTLTVIKTGDVDAYIISEPGGIYYGDVNSAEFSVGVEVVLIIPDDDSIDIASVSGDYKEWVGNLIYVEIEHQDKTIEIELEEASRTLEVIDISDEIHSENITRSRPEGIDCGDTCIAEMPYNQNIELYATSDIDYHIVMWELEGVTINRRGYGFGAIFTWKEGDYLYVVPDPYPGYVFQEWTGEYDSIDGTTIAVKIDEDKVVNAYFGIPTRTLTVNHAIDTWVQLLVISEPGTYRSDEDGNTLELMIGTDIHLIAQQIIGGSVIWEGDYELIQDNVIKVSLDTNKTIDIHGELDTSIYNYGYVCGGKQDFPTPHKVIHAFEFPLDNGSTTQQIGEMDTNRVWLSSLNSTQYIFVAGGHSMDAYLSSIERFNFGMDLSQTSTTGSLSTPKRRMAATNSSLYGYFCGGNYQATVYSGIERMTFPFDQGASTQKVANIETTRRGIVAVNNTNYTYACGGLQAGNIVSRVERFEFAMDSEGSEQVADLEQPVSYTSSYNSSTYGYICSGQHDHGYHSNIQRFEYPLDGGRTDIYTEIAKHRIYSAGNNSTQYGYICGGESVDDGNSVSTIEKMQFSMDSANSEINAELGFSSDALAAGDSVDFIQQFNTNSPVHKH